MLVGPKRRDERSCTKRRIIPSAQPFTPGSTHKGARTPRRRTRRVQVRRHKTRTLSSRIEHLPPSSVSASEEDQSRDEERGTYPFKPRLALRLCDLRMRMLGQREDEDRELEGGCEHSAGSGEEDGGKKEGEGAGTRGGPRGGS